MGLPETYASLRYLIGDNLAGRKRLLLDQLYVQLEGLGLAWEEEGTDPQAGLEHRRSVGTCLSQSGIVD